MPAAIVAPPTAVIATAPVVAAVAAAPVAAVKVVANAGETLYKQACSACHVAGVAGAPKSGDKAAWAPRIKTGIDAMTASVIKGKGAMPARGGSAGSDADIRAAVEYMANAAKESYFTLAKPAMSRIFAFFGIKSVSNPMNTGVSSYYFSSNLWTASGLRT